MPPSKTVSRKLLGDRAVPVEVMVEGDSRIAALEGAVVPYERREDYVREIGALWSRAQNTFLTIGAYLNLAKERLAHGEFNAMISRDLPFGPTTAFHIRAAAEAVNSGRLPREQMPPNYTTIYTLSTLPDEDLAKARKAGLLRPDLRRIEVLEFKKRLVTIEGEADPAALRARRLTDLRRRLADLQRQEAEVEAEIARLEGEGG